MTKPIIIPDLERRVTGDVQIEKREGEDTSRRIVGYALKFNVLSRDLGGYQERISPNALDGVSLDDVVALFNHEPNLILARTSAKSLTLTVDATGLRYEFTAPNTTAGNDLVENVSNGNVSGSSFAFRAEETKWEEVGETYIRNIMKFKQIVDVSPVVFPAYPDATVGKRSLEEFVKSKGMVIRKPNSAIITRRALR